MKTIRNLMMVIGLGLIVSCSIPTVPEFPSIACEKIKLTNEELKGLSSCTKNLTVCGIKFTTIKKILNIVQAKSSCLEQYQAAAKTYR